MKIVQVSDLHLVRPGERIFGIDPLSRLEDCIADINAHHADAALVVFSGDLTHNGEQQAYAALARTLEGLVPPFRLMLGNHDDRDAFRTAFPQAPMEDGFVQSFADLDGLRAAFLDTLDPGQVSGRLCEARLDWLDRALAGAADVILFLHHPPSDIAIPSLDAVKLAEPERLAERLARHGNVRHISAGHVHRLAAGSWRGIPFTTLRGTCQQSALALTGPHAVAFDPPAYAVLLPVGDGIVVHFHEFPVRA